MKRIASATHQPVEVRPDRLRMRGHGEAGREMPVGNDFKDVPVVRVWVHRETWPLLKDGLTR
jgi:hypothetical protein